MLSIRPARLEDVPALHAMLYESAVEQGEAQSLCATEQSLAEDGFGPSPRFLALIAEEDNHAIGVALYFFIYSTWTSRNGLYLEDIYVRPGYRKLGVARRFIQHLAALASQNDCRRIVWLVLRDNPAVEFYRRMGATGLENWMPMEMRSSAIVSAVKLPARETHE